MSHARLHKEYHITWILRKTHLKQHLTKHWINSWEFYNDRNLTLSTRGQGSSVWKTKIWITRRCITSFFQEVAQQGKGKKKRKHSWKLFLILIKKKKREQSRQTCTDSYAYFPKKLYLFTSIKESTSVKCLQAIYLCRPKLFQVKTI